jgi:dihydroflavonol-4-reductase
VKILIIGATGQLGHALTQRLVESGHDITLLIRRSLKTAFAQPLRTIVEPVFDEQAFEKALQGIECVVYGVGLPEQFAFDRKIFERVNLGLLQSFLRAMARTTIRRLVYVSTYEVFGAVDGQIRETHAISGLEGLSPYFRAMTMAYREVNAFATQTKTKLTTIHPAAIYGGLNTGDGFTNVIENLINRRFWKLPVVLPGRFPLVHARSLAEAIVASLDHEGAFIVSDGMCSLATLAATLRQLTPSYRPPEVPAVLAYLLTAPLEALGRILKFRPMLCKVQLDFITNGDQPLAEKAIKTLEWKPSTLEAGLKQYITERDHWLAYARDQQSGR